MPITLTHDEIISLFKKDIYSHCEKIMESKEEGFVLGLDVIRQFRQTPLDIFRSVAHVKDCLYKLGDEICAARKKIKSQYGKL